MDEPNVTMITWANVRIGLPFTFLVIAVSYKVRLNHVPVTYYMNLLVSDLIQLITLIVFMANSNQEWRLNLYLTYFHTYVCASMGSLCFRMVIALERYFFISLPQLRCIRQTNGLVMICLPVWLLFIFIIPVFIVSHQNLFIIYFPLFSVLLFIFCLAETIISLPAATSVTVEDKHRVVGILVLLLVHYTVAALPTVIYFIYAHGYPPIMIEIIFVFSLLSFLLDLVHVFVCTRPMSCFCCCRMESTAVNHNPHQIISLIEAQTAEHTGRQIQSKTEEAT